MNSRRIAENESLAVLCTAEAAGMSCLEIDAIRKAAEKMSDVQARRFLLIVDNSLKTFLSTVREMELRVHSLEELWRQGMDSSSSLAVFERLLCEFVDVIVFWRNLLTEPLPFLHNGENYLLALLLKIPGNILSDCGERVLEVLASEYDVQVDLWRRKIADCKSGIFIPLLRSVHSVSGALLLPEYCLNSELRSATRSFRAFCHQYPGMVRARLSRRPRNPLSTIANRLPSWLVSMHSSNMPLEWGISFATLISRLSAFFRKWMAFRDFRGALRSTAGFLLARSVTSHQLMRFQSWLRAKSLRPPRSVMPHRAECLESSKNVTTQTPSFTRRKVVLPYLFFPLLRP